MTTTSLVRVQAPFTILHRNTYTPAIIPVTVDAGLLGAVIVGVLGPLMNNHVPVPGAAAFPARVVLVTLQRFWLMPALDAIGVLTVILVYVLSFEEQFADVVVSTPHT